jgi:hypothetical protein
MRDVTFELLVRTLPLSEQLRRLRADATSCPQKNGEWRPLPETRHNRQVPGYSTANNAANRVVARSLITAIESVVCMESADSTTQNLRPDCTRELDVDVRGKHVICPSVLLGVCHVAGGATEGRVGPTTVIAREGYNVAVQERFMLGIVGKNDKLQVTT